MPFLRIIAGRLKGRRLAGPTGQDVRPTSDRLRETLFNVLGPSLDGLRVVDGFAGTGALGLEAFSRGAAHVTFIERDRRAIALLQDNIARCGVEKACVIIREDFLAGAGGESFDLVLLDPPYDIENLDAVLETATPLVAPGGRLVLEHRRRRASPDRVPGLHRTRVLEAGDSALSFYSPVVE